jgi:hypothetical protein
MEVEPDFLIHEKGRIYIWVKSGTVKRKVGREILESKRQIPVCLAHYPTSHCAALSAHFLSCRVLSSTLPSTQPSLQKLNYTVSVREQLG